MKNEFFQPGDIVIFHNIYSPGPVPYDIPLFVVGFRHDDENAFPGEGYYIDYIYNGLIDTSWICSEYDTWEIICRVENAA